MAWGSAGQREEFSIEIDLSLAEDQPISKARTPWEAESPQHQGLTPGYIAGTLH